ncbi:hypothetical protein [Streptococcus suis]|uniref:hypothetical protein n=1 Tax=Streptococcus suis TaxID=1307 RepID=UPI001C9801AC|nr:hypothetical protein [Streptococcus suis]MBY5009432.1 hypothetical protein [Streptococcus suis]MDG4519505.1 hypothetical protein [Streptococcus suis]
MLKIGTRVRPKDGLNIKDGIGIIKAVRPMSRYCYEVARDKGPRYWAKSDELEEQCEKKD